MTFRNGIPFIEEREIKGIVFAITGIILAFFGIYHTTINRTYALNFPLFIAALVALVCVIIALTALIIHLHKKWRERLAAEEKFRQQEAEFTKLRRELIDLGHRYQDVIPAVKVACGSLLDTLNYVNDENRQEYLEKTTQQINAIHQMASEMSEEFAIDGINNAVASLGLPEGYFPLEARIRQVMEQCREKGIGVFIRNIAPDELWADFTLSKTKFTRLVGNLLSNAVKELEKSEDAGRQVIISFSDCNGIFAFEIRDNAHAFPPQILAKLGQRGNSTNGTGNGYAEIFEILDECKASFELRENHADGKDNKTVCITFDQKSWRVILTTYRYEALVAALEDTSFVVDEWDF